MKPSVGDRLDLEITKVVHGGYGLGRRDGYVVFVKGALPGEQVSVEIRDAKKSHGFADLIEVTQASPHRVDHVWPEASHTRAVAERAGGADYGHIERGYQLTLKAEVIYQSVERFSPASILEMVPSEVRAIDDDPSGLHWRTRVSLHVNEAGRAGPYAEGSHTVVETATLPLATEDINSLGVHRQDWAGHRQIRLVHSAHTSPRIVVDDQKPTTIEETVAGHVFHLSDQGFWQVHRNAAEALFTLTRDRLSVLDLSPGEQHLDLYAGVGLFSRAVTDAAKGDVPLISVEADNLASEYAAQNLADLNKSQTVSSRVDRFLRHFEPTKPLGAVVLDPPRSGAGRDVIDALALLRPRAVIYIACDPVALARDLSHFHEHGYSATAWDALDLFPHTHHVESVVVLERT